jgi:hypothetical protein
MEPSLGGAGAASITDRMMRAVKLDSQVYEEVEHDLAATSQAFTVVVIVALASGIGSALNMMANNMSGQIPMAFVGGVVLAILGWLIWSGLAYIIGTKVFGGVATYGELLRTVGFANSPGVLNFFSFVPVLGGLLSFVVAIWILVAVIVAMRQALDFDTGKAVLTAIVGFIAYMVLMGVLGIFGLMGGMIASPMMR